MRILKVVAVAMLLVAGLTVCASAQAATHSVILNWTDASNPAGTTYSIYRAPSACTGTPVFAKITSGLTAKTYTDAALQPGTFCYAATATLNALESGQSNPFLAPIPPFPPQGLTITIQ